MLQEHSELATEQEYQENLRVHEAAAQIIPHLSIDEGASSDTGEIKIDETIPEDVAGEQSSDTISIDNDLTVSSLDSEQEERDKSDYFAVGMNVSTYE